MRSQGKIQGDASLPQFIDRRSQISENDLKTFKLDENPSNFIVSGLIVDPLPYKVEIL